jgi:hypothetical protein
MIQREIMIEESGRDPSDVPVPIQPDLDIGPIQPAHLAEARRRLLSRGELIPSKPKPMFLRRP